LCNLCKPKPKVKKENGVHNETVRKQILKSRVREVRAMLYKKPNSFFDSVINKCSFLDFIMKTPCPMQPVNISNKNFTIHLPADDKKEIWDFTSDKDVVKLFVLGYDGRLLEKVRCEIECVKNQ